MTNPLFSSTPLPPNPLLDFNLNTYLNPETTVHNYMYNVEYRQPGTLYKPVSLEPLMQIRVSHALFEVTNVVDFGHI